MLESGKKLLNQASKKGYALGAFNTSNLEISQAIIKAAEELKLKEGVIIQTSETAIKYAGLKNIYRIVASLAEEAKIPVCLHLDHGRTMPLIKKCIEIGYTSVMIDASHHKFEKNICLTKKVVGWAHKKKVSVEAELGTIGGKEDYVKGKIQYTDPEKATEFVKKTRIDSLAVAIGTSHGPNKFVGLKGKKPKLDINRLKKIKKELSIPLVLHGASEVPQNIVAKANKFGARIRKASGVPESQLKKAIKGGINKINEDTDLRLCFTATVRGFLKKKPAVFDPRKIIGAGREEIKKLVKKRMVVFRNP